MIYHLIYCFIAFPYNTIRVYFEAGEVIWIDSKSEAVLDHNLPLLFTSFQPVLVLSSISVQ